jgi:2Fe-2S ferredoxin
MVKVYFDQPDGQRLALDLEEGESLMKGAVMNSVDGILADCGGALTCATCHVYVDDAWLERTGEVSPDEAAMLEFVVEPRKNSRLSCQIKLAPDLDGLVVRVPERQEA